MDQIFFQELELPAPNYNLNIGPGKHSNQIGNILIKVEPILEKERPDYVLVQGDTNTVLAGGLAASRQGIKIGHIEAGLRSYDKTMPEETNRFVTDYLSQFLFAVTNMQKDILLKENIAKDRIFVVGNTIVDSLQWQQNKANGAASILQRHKLKIKEYVLLTAHRSSNVDNKKSLSKLLEAIKAISSREQVVWPIHPRTQKSLTKFDLNIPKGIKVIEPIGHLDFLSLEKNAKMVLTDSGGVQEECCILGTPCITLRENTERPESISVGGNQLVGTDLDKLMSAYYSILSDPNKLWENPFGKGNSARRILEIIQNDFYQSTRQNDIVKKVCVIGLGYIGLPMATLVSQSSYEVIGVDIDSDKIDQIKKGHTPFSEDGLDTLLESALTKGFMVQTDIAEADIFMVAVPTPLKNSKCDLSYVRAVCDQLAAILKDDSLVIIESTIPPGTCELLQREIFDPSGKKIHLAHCPERAIPGDTVNELINNDRVIGGVTTKATELASLFYEKFCKGKIFKTNATTAECCKLMENSYRAVNIALANEFDTILAEHQVDSLEAIRLANRHPRVNILAPGPGVGGHCIPIDPMFLVEESQRAQLIPTAQKINGQRPIYCAHVIAQFCNKNSLNKIGILGVAYKKNVDDTRETPALPLIKDLIEQGLQVKVCDPYVKKWDYPVNDFSELVEWSDVFVLVTEHDKFLNFNYADKVVINTNSLFKTASSLRPLGQKI